MLFSLPQDTVDYKCLETILNKPQVTTVISSERTAFSLYMYIVKVECSPMQILTQIPFKAGDKAYFIPVGYEIDLTLLPQLGYWDGINNCGSLKGPLKNVTHISAIKKQLSYGILLKYDENNPINLDLIKPYNPPIGEDFIAYRSEPLVTKLNNYLPTRKEVAAREEYLVLEKAPGLSMYFYQRNGSFNVMNFGKARNVLMTNPYLAAQGLVYKNMRSEQSILLSLYDKYKLDNVFDTIKTIKSATSVFIHASVLFPNNLYHDRSTGTMVINKILVDGNSLPIQQEIRLCDINKVRHIGVIAQSSVVTAGNAKIFMDRPSCFMKPFKGCDQSLRQCPGLYLRNPKKPEQDVYIDNPAAIVEKKGVDLL